MPTFGYFHAHYLFSSALILAMSSFVPIGNPSDMTGFDSALDLLRSMTENGNLAAAEFYKNLEQVKICLDSYRGLKVGRSERSAEVASATNVQADTGSAPGFTGLSTLANVTANSSMHALPSNMSNSATASAAPLVPTHEPATSAPTGLPIQQGIDAYSFPVRDTISGYTTEMAFLEPTMQDFLAQSDIDLGLLHPVDAFFNEAENLYTCHEL